MSSNVSDLSEGVEPCPFCGGPAAMQDAYLAHIMREAPHAYCGPCGFSLPVERWNRRATLSPPASPQGVEQLARELVDRLEFIHADPAYQGVWTMLAVRGAKYTGPTYEHELAALKAALSHPLSGDPI